MTLRPDLVLVALPPRERVLTTTNVVVLPAPSIMVDRVGLVLQTGDRVVEVERGEHVLFGADVGEEVRIYDWPCLLLRADDIDAILELR